MRKLILASLVAVISLFYLNPATACTKTVCGNGKVEKGEQCDDGNKNDNDSCSNKCEKQIIKKVPVEKIIEVEKEVIKEVPVEVEKIVKVEVPVEVEKIVKEEVEVEVEKIVYKDKKKKKKKKSKKTLPKTGFPVAGLGILGLTTALGYGAYKKAKK